MPLHFTDISRNATVSEHSHDALKALIDKKNRRIQKLGGDPITLTSGTTYYRRCLSTLGIEYKMPVRDITLSGRIPHMGDWKIAIKIDHAAFDHGVNLVHCLFPHLEETAKTLIQADTHCEHCNTRRKRNATYLLEHVDTQEQLKVGASCLKDFVPDNVSLYAFTADALIALFESIKEEDGEPDFAGGGLNGFALDLADFLTMVVADADRNGWRPTSEDESTADAAVYGCMKTADKQATFPKAYAKAKAMIAYVNNELQATSSFEMNLVNVVTADAVTAKTAGIASALYPVYQRHLKRQAEGVGEYVGEIKQRMTQTLTYTGVKEKDCAYAGIAYSYAFQDTDGNELRWSSAKPMAFTLGEQYPLTFTVKQHSEFMGKRYTHITRAKLAQ